MATNPTIGELYKAKAVTEAVNAIMANPAPIAVIRMHELAFVTIANLEAPQARIAR